jgi:hypothetical protein
LSELNLRLLIGQFLEDRCVFGEERLAVSMGFLTPTPPTHADTDH